MQIGNIIDYIKMPPALVVLGGMYILYAGCHITRCIFDGYWRGIFSEIVKITRTKSAYIIISFIVIIVAILFIDKPITQLCKSLYNQQFYTMVDFICSMAEGWFVGGVLITLALIYQLLNNKYYVTLYKISLMATLYTGVFNAIAKFIFNRQRPSIGLNPWHFFHFIVSKSHNLQDLVYAFNSMPSGHTITLVAAVTPFFLASKNRLLRMGLILIWLLVGFSRIYTINHWLSDVLIATIFGAIIGAACYKINAHRLK
jgi:membrane-associated phospholipid phosphatase